jgi:hypothetical protein
MQYDRPTTESHPLSQDYPKCVNILGSVILAEGGSCISNLGDDIMVLNLDNVAIAQKASNIVSTMDVTFGITNESGRNAKMVLVDFKFRQKNVENIGKSDLEDKVKGSVSLMGSTPPILPQYYFVFPPKLKNQAISRIARLFSNRPNIPYKSVDIDDLLAIYFQ